MLTELTDEFFQGSASCRDRYADIANKLRMEVTNPEELDRLRRDMEKAFAERDGLQADLDACTALSEVLERAFHWPSLDEQVAARVLGGDDVAERHHGDCRRVRAAGEGAHQKVQEGAQG